MPKQLSTTDQVIVAIRRVIRAVELHSRSLVSSHGLTGPQATVLNSLSARPMTAGELARRINLSQGTVTDILNRLEQKHLLTRSRDNVDGRRVNVELTPEGRVVHDKAPPLLQENFSRKFNQLEDWEQTMLLAAIQRIAHLMDDEKAVNLAPILTNSPAIEEEQINSTPGPKVAA